MGYFIIAMALVFMLAVGYFGSQLGYVVDGIPQGVPTNALAGTFEYLGAMLTFQVDNLNPAIVGFFMVVLVLVAIVAWRLIRGGG